MAGFSTRGPGAAEEDGDQGVSGTAGYDGANTQVIGLTVFGSDLGMGSELVDKFLERAERMVWRDSWGKLVARCRCHGAFLARCFGDEMRIGMIEPTSYMRLGSLMEAGGKSK